MSERPEPTYVSLVSRLAGNTLLVTVPMSPDLIDENGNSADYVRPYIQQILRAQRDIECEREGKRRGRVIPEGPWREEWYIGDVTDQNAFIRNREPKRLDW